MAWCTRKGWELKHFAAICWKLLSTGMSLWSNGNKKLFNNFSWWVNLILIENTYFWLRCIYRYRVSTGQIGIKKTNKHCWPKNKKIKVVLLSIISPCTSIVTGKSFRPPTENFGWFIMVPPSTIAWIDSRDSAMYRSLRNVQRLNCNLQALQRNIANRKHSPSFSAIVTSTRMVSHLLYRQKVMNSPCKLQAHKWPY